MEIISFRDFQCCISISGIRSDWFQIEQGVHQWGHNSQSLHQLYIDDMLNKLLQSGYGAKIYDIDVVCATFGDDVELVTLSPIGLHNMLDICFRYIVNILNEKYLNFNLKCMWKTFNKTNELISVQFI